MTTGETSRDKGSRARPSGAQEPPRSRLAKALYVIAGSVALALGVVGVFLPLLPTTPFLLLTAACYMRGSDRLHDWLLSHRYLGRFIHDYRTGRGMERRAKILSLTLLWITIGCSMLWVVSHPAARIALLAVAVGVTAHLLRLPTAGRSR